MSTLSDYLQQTRSELEHVSWPTRNQTLAYTFFVAAISFGIALYLGVFDFVFTSALKKVIETTPSATPSAVVDTSAAVSTSTNSFDTIINQPTVATSTQ